MAIIDTRPGIEVTVISGDDALPEYRDTAAENSPHVITNYIDVGKATHFEVLTKFKDNNTVHYGVVIDVLLDGVKVHSKIYRLKQLEKPEGYKASGVSSKIRGRWHISNFLFSPFVLGNYMDFIFAER